ncbi:MAG: AEC family transporter [Candidatus Bipolaricaulia bacterium]
MDSQYLLITYNVLPVILLIAGGKLLQQFDFLSRKAVDGIKDIVVNIGLPALLFTAFSSVKFQPKYLAVFAFMFGLCVGLFYLGKLIARIFNIESRIFPFMMTGFEAGMLGYPVFQATFGESELFKFAIVDFGQVTFVFLVFVPLLIRMAQEKSEKESPVLMFLKSPPVIGILFGLLFGTLGVFEGVSKGEFTNVILTTLNYLGALVVPLICLVIGYELQFNPKGLKKALLTTVIRLTVLVVVGVALGGLIFRGLLGFGHTFVLAFATMLILPPPFVTPIFLEPRDEEEKKFVLNTLSIHTIATLLVFIPLMIYMI